VSLFIQRSRGLEGRGWPWRGVDEDGYADWVSLASGTLDHYPCDDPGLDFHAWQAAHNWVLSLGGSAS